MKAIYIRPLILILFLASGSARADVPSNPIFDRWTPNREVYSIARANGKLYIGGLFWEISPFTGSGVFISEKGNLENSWPQITGGSVMNAVPDGSGGWFIGGFFSHVGGIERRYLAHIGSNGTLDTTWNPPNSNSYVFQLAVSGGKVYAGGKFTFNGGISFQELARFNVSDGTLDSDWSPPNVGPDVLTIAVSGGKVYAGGWSKNIGGLPSPYLVRFNESDGNLDSSWNPPSLNDRVLSIAVIGGKVYAGGGFTKVGGTSFPYLARFNESDGSLDVTWTPGLNDPVFSIVSSGGKIYAGGHFTNSGGWLVRFNESDGGIDSAWNPPAMISTVFSIAVSGGKVYAGGSFGHVGGSPSFARLARFNESDGSLDTTWNPPNPNNLVFALAVSDGDIFVGGYFNGFGGVSINHLARFNESDGSLDIAWKPPEPDGTVDSILVSGGKIYLGGSFGRLGNTSVPYLARLNESDGTLDNTWNPSDPNNSVRSLAISGGKVYVGGWFTSLGGKPFPYLARFNESDGSLDNAWNPPDPSDSISSIAVSGEKIYAGGGFTKVGGMSFPYLARFNKSDGSLDNAWNPPDPSHSISSIAVSGEKIYAGGVFTRVGGMSFPYLARFNESDGSLDNAWNPPDPSDSISSIAVSGEKIYAGGLFTQVGGMPFPYLARFNLLDGSLDNAWNPPDPDGEILSIAGNGDSLRVGGRFNSLGDHGPSFMGWFGNAVPLAPPVSGEVSSVGSQSVSATWLGVSGATGYRLEASFHSSYIPSISPESVATPSSNNGTVTGLQPNRTYYLFVNSCESVCSNYYSLGSTVTLANPPVSLSSGSVTETTVGLSFSANGNPAGTTYLVQKATAIGGPYSTVLTTTLVAPTITDLAVGTTYLFQVLARNLSGTTTTSVGPVSVMTGLTTPDLILETVGASSAQLTIVPKGNPAGTVYVLQQSGDNGGTFTNVSTGMDLLVTVTGLSAGKSYQFRVAALDQFGNSTTPSGVVLATPAKFSAETARAYPVPFRSKLGQNTITFDQLPSGATVKLFSMKGQLVRTLSVDGGTQVDWDVKNQDGQPVVSGVYLALIDANGSQKTLKVAVQR